MQLHSRAALSFLTLVFAATGLSAQDWSKTHSLNDLESFLVEQFTPRGQVDARRALNAAAAKGWVVRAADRILFKRQFRSIARRRGTSGRLIDLRPRALNVSNATPPTMAQALAEKEYNDSACYGQDLGPITPVAQTITGALATGESDNFTIRLVTDSLLSLTASSLNGTNPQVIVTNKDGDEIWGMSWQRSLPLQIELPAGQYNVRLYQQSGSSTYGMSMQATTIKIPVINLSGSTSVSVSTNLKCLKLVTAADGRVNLTLKSATGADTYLWLLNGNWRYMHDVDDVTTVDAGLDAHLPKGTYYVYVYADKSDTTSVTGSFSSAAIPALTSAGVAGTIKGYHSFDVYKFTVGTGQK